MTSPPTPNTGNGTNAQPAPPARDRWPAEASGTAMDDATTLRRIVLFLVLCGVVGFTVLIASIAFDWNTVPTPVRNAPRD